MNALVLAVLFALSVFTGISRQKPQDKSQEKTSCPMRGKLEASQDDRHHQGVIGRGDQVMGFSHEKTAHHFRLYADGGAIEADANGADDAASRDAIRMHLRHIAKVFAEGEFSAPMLIHGQNPPGAEEMKRLRDAIQYNFENTERGARIRMVTKNREALVGLHQFLRFQIADHQTGDATEITKLP